MNYYINPKRIDQSHDATWDPVLHSISTNVPKWMSYARQHDFILVLAPMMRSRYEVHVLDVGRVQQLSQSVEITTLAQLKSVQLKNLVSV